MASSDRISSNEIAPKELEEINKELSQYEKWMNNFRVVGTDVSGHTRSSRTDVPSLPSSFSIEQVRQQLAEVRGIVKNFSITGDGVSGSFQKGYSVGPAALGSEEGGQVGPLPPPSVIVTCPPSTATVFVAISGVSGCCNVNHSYDISAFNTTFTCVHTGGSTWLSTGLADIYEHVHSGGDCSGSIISTIHYTIGVSMSCTTGGISVVDDETIIFSGFLNHVANPAVLSNLYTDCPTYSPWGFGGHATVTW